MAWLNGPVADVVEQGRAEHLERSSTGIEAAVAEAQPVEHAAGDVDDAQAVREAGVLGAVVDEVGEAELADPAQTLERPRLDERNKTASASSFRSRAMMLWTGSRKSFGSRLAVEVIGIDRWPVPGGLQSRRMREGSRGLFGCVALQSRS